MGVGVRLAYNDTALAAGNCISNEPGYYEDGKFGVRIESIVIVRPAKTPHNFNGKGSLCFEQVTLVSWFPSARAASSPFNQSPSRSAQSRRASSMSRYLQGRSASGSTLITSAAGESSRVSSTRGDGSGSRELVRRSRWSASFIF